MRFGPVPVADAEGAVLAHSLGVDGLRLKKGRTLTASDVAALGAAGVAEVTVARLEPDDLAEDAAAEAVAAGLAPVPAELGLARSAPFTGRVNLFAEAAGVLRVDAAAVGALNAVDTGITLATLPDFTRVRSRQMVATVKVIPYGVAAGRVAAAAAAGAGALRVHGFRRGTASLILTRTPGFKESLLAKGAEAVAARLEALGWAMAPPVTVAHETAAVAAAIGAAAGNMVLILGGSATSDAADVAPAGLVAAGGRLVRFGMPVDPGNLLFVGEIGGRPVVGLPGSARSPAPHGVDWVLERLAAGLPVGDAEIAAMGVGGLLKEIPARPQPRARRPEAPGRARVAALVLAAGAARRMRGRDKLLEDVGGRPVLRAVAEAAKASRADEVVVVLPPGATARRSALDGLAVGVVEAPDWAEGMAASLRAGLAEVAGRADAVVVLLADMPETGAREIDRLIAAFDPEEGREIARAVSADGTPGHPVLFGRRFFETLAGLRGDRGAREVLSEAAEFVTEVPTPGRAALVDLDTPEDWAAWRAAAAEKAR
jgi:molybdenum cofactor cytidylyltransferase